MNPSSGNKMYKGVQVPVNVKILIAPSGREFRLSTINKESQVTIRYIDNNESKIITLEQYNAICNQTK